MSIVFVTGGAGFIGSHTAKALSYAGFQPVVVDNLSRGFAEAVKWGPLEVVDLNDGAALRPLFQEYAPVAVLHFAAYAYVGESVSQPFEYYRNNVAGTLALLDVMREAGCDKLVFSSTCATYGIPESVPISEDTRQAPVNPYGHSKLMMEQILKDADLAYALKSVALRYFNAGGADPDGEIGENHDPETHLIPLVLQAAAGTGSALTVFGDDYATPDGSCIRDYVHVSDLADAHVLALRWLVEGGETSVFNLGNERGYSVFEVIEAAKRVTGLDVPFTIGQRRAGDPPELVASAAKARAELNWKPKRAALDLQIEDAWRWQQKRMG